MNVINRNILLYELESLTYEKSRQEITPKMLAHWVTTDRNGYIILLDDQQLFRLGKGIALI